MFPRFSHHYFLRRGLHSRNLRRGTILGGLSSSTLLFLPILNNSYVDSERVYPKHPYSSLHNLWNDFFFEGWSDRLGHSFRNFSVIGPSTNSGVVRVDSASMVNRVRGQLNVDVFAPRLPTLEWTLLGIFNGNSGSSTSEHLHENLLNAITGFLADIYSSYNCVAPEYLDTTFDGTQHPSSHIYPPPEKIDNAIAEAFQSVDNDIVHDRVQRVFNQNSKEVAVKLLSPAMSRSGAIVGFFDGREKTLKIAVAGGAGAVLGRRVESFNKLSSANDTRYKVEVITAPQPTFKHPITGEQKFVHSFGDAMFKWSEEIQKRLHENFLGDIPIPDSSHPKVTAEPIISTVKIHPGDFVVMANSGIWDCLGSDDVVGLVAVWLRRNQIREEDAHVEVVKINENTQISYKVYKPSYRDSKVVLNPEDLPVIKSKSPQSPPAARGDKNLSWVPNSESRRFINIDSNAASHIIRNAIGGANTDLIRAFENMDPIRAESHRDDFGVQVIFFK
ncbi:phosphatase 2C-like domain-containing protein [Cyathus striatus]|nr:phosphatase 2C-like domain-containing protein [Cyathus striatus]